MRVVGQLMEIRGYLIVVTGLYHVTPIYMVFWPVGHVAKPRDLSDKQVEGCTLECNAYSFLGTWIGGGRIIHLLECPAVVSSSNILNFQ